MTSQLCKCLFISSYFRVWSAICPPVLIYHKSASLSVSSPQGQPSNLHSQKKIYKKVLKRLGKLCTVGHNYLPEIISKVEIKLDILTSCKRAKDTAFFVTVCNTIPNRSIYTLSLTVRLYGVCTTNGSIINKSTLQTTLHILDLISQHILYIKVSSLVHVHSSSSVHVSICTYEYEYLILRSSVALSLIILKTISLPAVVILISTLMYYAIVILIHDLVIILPFSLHMS